MKSIGIIANPASGKDIRRLVSYATTIDNNEKVNIVKRVIMTAQQLGVEKFYIMPDNYHIGLAVANSLERKGQLTAEIEVLDYPVRGNIKDTLQAVQLMEAKGVEVILVLGGDGTSRAVAKVWQNSLILPLSTGTNNVYPSMTEGTVAGMAAAVGVLFNQDASHFCIQDKVVEIYRNDVFTDIALIDAVITKDLVSGSKAVWNKDKLKWIIATRCHPASIGFSSIPGMVKPCLENDDFGVVIEVGEGKTQIFAPIAAGMIEKVNVGEAKVIGLTECFQWKADDNYMIALDGEREIAIHKDDDVSFCITKKGPRRILINKAIEFGVAKGLFRI